MNEINTKRVYGSGFQRMSSTVHLINRTLVDGLVRVVVTYQLDNNLCQGL